uniref:SAC3/GANP/THP3 conserved domain-containing protein n=1 Tax=Phytophthora ramorum TaxID=164328 RepID=H3HB61_PHYRM
MKMETPTPLTEQMRAATREIHSVSDNLVNLKLVVALTDKELYGRALMLFYYVYAQLESSIKIHKEHEAFSGLYELLDEIARADKIAKDLRYYLGEDWNTKYQPTPAVQDYVKHLQELGKKNPILALPYCYHMYMAILAGGVMIKKLVKRSFKPPEGDGLNAFAFDVKSNKALRDTIKDKINAVPYDEATKKLILVESMNCFKMNNQVVGSLDGAGNHVMKFILKWIAIIGLILAELSRFERPVVVGVQGLVPVKKYRRAAAGRDVWNALELRPAPVLLRTLRHLFTTVLPWPKSGFEAWELQSSAEFLARIEDASLVTALQQAARFYLLAGLRSVQLLGDVKTQQDWSDKLNDEQLASALSQLQALYDLHEMAGFDHEDVPELHHAGEFVAYDLLLHAEKPQEVAWMLLKLSPKLRSLPAVQRALRAFVAVQTDDFHAFFAEFGAMTLLERAASLRHLSKMWTHSLRMINKGFGKQDRFPLEELARWMRLADPRSEGEARSEQDDVADSWEIVDDLAQPESSLSVAKPSSIGFAQFKLAPLHDQMDSGALRPLLRAVALQMEKGLADKGALETTTELIMGEAHETTAC